MIPKIIHYCWFGGKEMPNEATKCIESWRKFCPGYEIKEWNEQNFDVYSIPYTTEAYFAGKYAFVSDYARYKILYEHGGLYFDTDVELIAPIDDIVARGPFMGIEDKKLVTLPNYPALDCLGINPGLGLGAEPGMRFYKEMLELYSSLHFNKPNGKPDLSTIVQFTTYRLHEYGLTNANEQQYISGIHIYPTEYFCPKHPDTGITVITPNSRSIHHYAASWVYQQNPEYIRLSKKYHWIPKVIRRHLILIKIGERRSPLSAGIIRLLD